MDPAVRVLLGKALPGFPLTVSLYEPFAPAPFPCRFSKRGSCCLSLCARRGPLSGRHLLSLLSAFEFSFTRSSSSSRPFVKPALSFSASEIFNHLSPPSLHSSKFRRQLAGLVYHQGFKGAAVSMLHLECEAQSRAGGRGRDKEKTRRTHSIETSGV